MRVILTTPYDLAVPGGVNRHTLGLFHALSRRKVDVRLLGPCSLEVPSDDPRIVHLGSIRVRSLNGARSRVTLDLGLGRAVRALMTSFRPTIVHLQEPFLPTLNAFVLAHAGTARRVGTFHTYSESSRGYLWTWPWCQWINRQLDARIAVSQAAKTFASRYHKMEMTVIAHGCDAVPEPERRPPGLPSSPVRLLFIGRADEPRKGFGTLLAAVALLDQRKPGAFVLQSIGRGTVRGEVSDAAIAVALTQADICVVPSLGGESFGLVALEALAHGVPVVASRIAGYAEWLADIPAAVLVEPGDAAGMAEAICSLAQPDCHSAAQEKAQAAAENYSWDRCVEETLCLYRGGEA